MADNFLDKAYGVKSVDEVRTLYDDWSDSYDDEMEANGYATPRRCSEALAGCSSDLAAPILDFGCGTGRSGLALKAAGFSTIDGADLSDDMLKGARDRGLYRTLWQVDPDADLPVTPGDYAAITAIGVIGAGAAPLEVFDTLFNALAPGGLFVFSFNDHALADPAYDGKVTEQITRETAKLRFREYGDHLPGINIKSNVYVLEKN